jgi:hypothetical protein
MGRLGVQLMIIAVAIGWAIPAESRGATGVTAPKDEQGTMAAIVAQIKRADFEDDKEMLKDLFEQLTAYVRDPVLCSFAHYWRGFAMWRRALNGFNDSSKTEELDYDLTLAAQEFAAARGRADRFVEAEIGEAACEGTLVFLHHSEPDRLRRHLTRDAALLKDLQETSPDNPRFLWVLGASLWSRPAAAGGNRAAALDTYRRGLQIIAHNRNVAHASLAPSWGEAELLMSLSWSSLHQTPPDLDEADRYAQLALRVASNWHFVRDILLPQIANTRAEMKR